METAPDAAGAASAAAIVAATNQTSNDIVGTPN
jgi:hypothetical protein